MARIRTIKPDFWTDEKVVELSPWARLLFIGTWNFADDDGRLAYSPKRLKMQIFPADDVDVGALVGELRRNSMVIVYSVQGTEYMQICNFAKHQKIDKRSASKLPPPPDSSESPRIPPDNTESPKFSSKTVEEHRIPPTEGKGREGKGKGIKPSPPVGDVFDRFWQAYPLKRSKGQAERTWSKLKPDSELVDRILAAIERAKTSVAWTKDNGSFIPYPATWLNAKGWEDEHHPVGVVSTDWWKSDEGMLAKGAELGVQRGSDDFIYFKARVCVAAGDGPWIDERNGTLFRLINSLRERVDA